MKTRFPPPLFLIVFLAGFLAFSASVRAQEVPPDPLFPGRIEGVGNNFEITDSEYLNLNLRSSEPIKISVDSVPQTVTMMLEAASSTPSTQITVSGFAPSVTYYKYEDDYHNLTEFTADENGSYAYTQDISAPHLVFIQPVKSTKFIKDDAMGGDCFLIGNWDALTKTCALTKDVYETIQIDSDGVVLDGNARALTGSNTGYGIYLYRRSGVIVKNLNVKYFTRGIFLNASANNNLIGNNASNNREGIYLYSSSNNYLLNNTTSNNAYGAGIWLALYSSNNNIQGGIVKFNNPYGIYIMYYSNGNIIANNTISNNGFYGINFFYAENNKIYNNNFIIITRDSYQAFNYRGISNVFNLSAPIGGNYWCTTWLSCPEYCRDVNSDGFCDTPYAISGDIISYDYLPWTKQDGWKNQPPTLPNPNQYKSDLITQIQENGITQESSVIFKATLTDPDSDRVKLQMELRQFNEPFTGTDDGGILNSDLVNSGSEAVVSRQSLVAGSYHWRARTVDSRGGVSDWQEFGIAGNVDFEVQLPLSYKAAELAKGLVNYPYLLGGKGWDYYQNLFVATDAIKTGYNFYNASTTSIDFSSGVDCSGLILWAYNRSFDPLKSRFNNFVKVEGADEQYNHNTTSTIESDLIPGDTMFFDWDSDGFMDHTAMYVGNNGDFDEVNKEKWLKEGKKSGLFLYNLFTKEKIFIVSVEEPLWWFKSNWLSDTELEYELPTGEKKIYKIQNEK